MRNKKLLNTRVFPRLKLFVEFLNDIARSSSQRNQLKNLSENPTKSKKTRNYARPEERQ